MNADLSNQMGQTIHPADERSDVWPERCDLDCGEPMAGRARTGLLTHYLCWGHLLAEPFRSLPRGSIDLLRREA